MESELAAAVGRRALNVAAPGAFALSDPAHRQELVRAHSLCWIVSALDGRFQASPIPVLPRLDDGHLAGFHGHFARSNPQVELLRRCPDALLLVQGPHHYVSPSWMRDRTQAPTWNYIASQYEVRLRLIDDDRQIEAGVAELVEAMEAGRPARWSLAEMRDRYTGLARGIIGFEADIVREQTRCKLGQDERDDVYADILGGLTASGAHELVAWMRRYNPGRAGAAADLPGL